jgi:hypothetical protein
MTEVLAFASDPRPEDMTSVEVDEALSRLANGEPMTANQREIVGVLYPDVIAALVEE